MMSLAIVATAAGLTVVLVTLLAERLGGEIGALLATAPVVSTFGLIWVLNKTQGGSPEVLLAGNFSILASLVGTVGYFLAVKWSRGGNIFRVLLAETAYTFLFISFAWLAARLLPLRPALFSLNFTLAGFLIVTFGRLSLEIPPVKPAQPQSVKKLLPRFLIGFVVVAMTGLATRIHPVLGGIVAVFPGTLVTTLGVIGISQSAAFSARVAQEGIPGKLSVLLFILGYWVALPWINRDPLTGIALGTALAWVQYFLGLLFFGGMACPFRGGRPPLSTGIPLLGCTLFGQGSQPGEFR